MRALVLDVFEATLRSNDVELKQLLRILRSVVTRVIAVDVESDVFVNFQQSEDIASEPTQKA